MADNYFPRMTAPGRVVGEPEPPDERARDDVKRPRVGTFIDFCGSCGHALTADGEALVNQLRERLKRTADLGLYRKQVEENTALRLEVQRLREQLFELRQGLGRLLK